MQPDLTQLLNDKHSNINSNWKQILLFSGSRVEFEGRETKIYGFKLEMIKKNKFSNENGIFSLEYILGNGHP